MCQSKLAMHTNVRTATGRRQGTELFHISECALAKVLHLTFLRHHLAVPLNQTLFFFAAVTFHTGCETYASFNQQTIFSRSKEAAVEPTKI